MRAVLAAFVAVWVMGCRSNERAEPSQSPTPVPVVTPLPYAEPAPPPPVPVAPPSDHVATPVGAEQPAAPAVQPEAAAPAGTAVQPGATTPPAPPTTMEPAQPPAAAAAPAPEAGLSDNDIGLRVRRELAGDTVLAGRADDVRVSVENGVVTLRGTATSEQDRAAYGARAATVVGEGRVRNELRVR